MSKMDKPANKSAKSAASFLPVDRRAFVTGAMLAGGAAAAGGGIVARERRALAEPDLTDMTSNAPSYAAHPPRHASAPAQRQTAQHEASDPLALALQG